MNCNVYKNKYKHIVFYIQVVTFYHSITILNYSWTAVDNDYHLHCIH
nr:MAG TPA: hypothetical protein [Caudoviricetes sp.]